MDFLVPILAAAVRSGTPILYATLGEILTERSGVLNLGIEGLMLMGALSGFIVTHATGNPWIGVIAAFLVGIAIAVIHAFLCVTVGANQVVSGLAITMFGTGASSLLGRGMIGETVVGFSRIPVPYLSKIPVLGTILFNHDPLVYLSYGLVAFLTWFIFYTRPGLNLRAVGESPKVVDAMGLSASKLRYFYTLVGGGLASVGGAYMSLAYTKMWGNGMTAGRGWIAVALVIFAIWHPARAVLGAYLFGGVGAMQLRIQAAGTSFPAPLLMMMPYFLTIIVLVVISIQKGRGILLGSPGSLGVPYSREERG
ncbi:MAG: ABC transporter permease [Thermovirgaceae bacterium]|nr:ABC transporter permease [Thermovirgaceae bacterium]